jgi:nucleotide-binding universal stress UspA family protein
MEKSTVLVVLNHETNDQFIEAIAETSVNLQIHVTCFVMSPGVEFPAAVYGVPPYGNVEISSEWKQLVDEALDLQKTRVDEIEQILARTAVSGDVQALLCNTTETRDHIARRARLSDVTVLAPNLSDTPQFMNEAAHGVLYGSASGLMLNGLPTSEFDRIMVAWDSSNAAASAVRAAMPYLKRAREVTIACFDPVASEDMGGVDPGTDLSTWLSHHGCDVVLSQYPSGGREIGQCIQDRAKEVGADLVVMGAYGHSRLLQAVFGGTTRSMLEQKELPVLMAH